MGRGERRWVWHAPGGPWTAVVALGAAAATAFVLATAGPGPAALGVALLVVMFGLILGVTPFGLAPTSRAPVRVGRFVFVLGVSVLLLALLAGPLPPAAAAVFGAGTALAVVVAAEMTDALVRRLSPARR